MNPGNFQKEQSQRSDFQETKKHKGRSKTENHHQNCLGGTNFVCLGFKTENHHQNNRKLKQLFSLQAL